MFQKLSLWIFLVSCCLMIVHVFGPLFVDSGFPGTISQVQADSITLPFLRTDPGVKHLPQIGLSEVERTIAGEKKTVTVGKGAEAFDELVRTIGSFLTRVMGIIAIMALFVAGYQMVTAQSAVSEQIEKHKMNVVYIMFGLIIFALSGDFVYNFLFVEQGSYLLEQESALRVAGQTVDQIRRLLNLFLSFAGAGAILMLVIASMRLIINPGSDEQIDKQKKLVGYTAVGIIMIGLADTVVNQILFAKGGTEGVKVDLLEKQLLGLSNYILGFLGAIVFVTFVVSGFVMVVHYGNDEMVTKVKSTMKNVVIGSLVAFSSYTIVATLIRTFRSAEGGAVTTMILGG